MRTVLSSLPDTARRPSGLKQQLLTQLLWPEKVNWKRCPGTDHTCTPTLPLSRVIADSVACARAVLAQRCADVLAPLAICLNQTGRHVLHMHSCQTISL